MSILGTTKKSQQDKFNDTKKGHKLLMEWVTRVIQRWWGSLFFREIMWPNPVTSNDLFCVVIFISSRSFWWYRWCHNWSFGRSFSFFSFFLCFFFLSPSSNLWREMRERKKVRRKKQISEALRNSDDDTICTIKKYLDERNPTAPEKVTNADQSGPHDPSKGKWASPPLDGSYGPLYSSLVTFLSFIGFVLSKSFCQYQWCCHRSFGVPLRSFSFFLSFFLSFSFLSLCCKFCQAIL